MLCACVRERNTYFFAVLDILVGFCLGVNRERREELLVVVDEVAEFVFQGLRVAEIAYTNSDPANLRCVAWSDPFLGGSDRFIGIPFLGFLFQKPIHFLMEIEYNVCPIGQLDPPVVSNFLGIKIFQFLK